ncbi:hypothetical protein HNQ74_001519 [Bartonella doshiae]|uniref:Uncharacterized protein n=2 Tax=Bartonella doshiae TaxID=33044 RepID=A0A380ZGS6_BARDO|nr:hypothetical protein MCS_01373 [Bartonella doshiae NCTC 12862 = ATCC 700133]MBB6160069.1 hypothetical protein [Bartonella doshiae]SUV45385.1 Uncharacterised protein [Bartonella doshiae]
MSLLLKIIKPKLSKIIRELSVGNDKIFEGLKDNKKLQWLYCFMLLFLTKGCHL